MSKNNSIFFDFSDRNITSFFEADFSDTYINKYKYNTNGKVKILDNSLIAEYVGKENVYQLKINLLNTLSSKNGVGVKFKVDQWQSINYIAIGFSVGKEFKHIKLFNFKQNDLLEFAFSLNDLIWKIQTKNELVDNCDISDIRVFIKGTPKKEKSFLIMYSFAVFEDIDNEESITKKIKNNSIDEILYDYYQWYFKTSLHQADTFMNSGLCPLTGGVEAKWSFKRNEPNIFEVNTNQFSWHALHPSLILLLKAYHENSISPLFSARELLNSWLSENLFQFNLSNKYIWYDHGTAERLIVFTLMYLVGIKHNFDQRFMVRLNYAIKKHAQLLESEAFYSANQNTRYHNHAWFQDIALVVVSIVFTQMKASEKWLSKAFHRLEDQLVHSFVDEESYSILIENSLGYHKGTENLTNLIKKLLDGVNIDNKLTQKLQYVKNFTELFSYPNGKLPSHGDTYRSVKQNEVLKKCKASTLKKEDFFCSTKAGYATVKRNFFDRVFVFDLFASSIIKTHKHQDNLSFTLFFDGIEWLIDPSFYSHQYEDPIPKHLRSVYAHNNIAIKGMDYSIEPGTATIEASEDNEKYILKGTHTCYKDTEIKREVKISKNNFEIEISDDILSSKKNIEAYSLLQVGENINVIKKENKIFLTHPNSEYKLCIDYNGLDTDIIEGFEEGRVFQGIIGHGFMQMVDGKCLVTKISDSSSYSIGVSNEKY